MTDGIHISGYDDGHIQELPIDSFFILTLESNDKCMLNSIQKIDFIDSLIIVQSSNGVFSFNNETGAYCCSYGERGHGVGEYNRINTFYIDQKNEEVNIVDGVRNQILIFDLWGEYLNSIKFPMPTLPLCSNAELIDCNELFIGKYIYNTENILYSKINKNKFTESTIVQTSFQTDNTQEFFGRHSFSIQNDTIRALVPYSNSVFYSSDNSLITEWIIDTKKDILTSRELKEINNFGIFSYMEKRNQNKFVGFTDIFETSRYTLLAFYNIDYFFVDKDSKKGFIYKKSQDDIVLQHVPLVDIKAVRDDFFVGVVEPYNLKKWSVSPTAKDKKLQNLKHTIDSISPNGNPVLFFYKLG